MTVHVLHAGDGYTYLTRQVSSGDHSRERSQTLSDYYLQHGNPPGEWVGAGLAGLEVSGTVAEAQMQNLFGMGKHPDAERIEAEAIATGSTAEEADRTSQLGRKFATYEDPDDHGYGEILSSLHAEFKAAHDRDPRPGVERDELRWAAARTAAKGGHDGQVTDAQVAQLLTQVGREKRQAVAGYDLVFTPAKSVSTLWALGNAQERDQVSQAHREAWQEALEWVQTEAGLTRMGAGGARQVNTHGLIAAAFDHLDSRAGDPNLHTHVAVSNRVQAKSEDASLDRRWLSLDGRVLHALAVAASERYNANVERELKARLGVQFAPEERTDGRMPVREISGIDKQVREEFSSRRAHIEAAYADLVQAYRSAHGRDPDRPTQHQLAQQATLNTRSAKRDQQPLATRVWEWRERAARVLGDESAVDRMVAGALGRARPQDLAEQPSAEQVVERVLDAVMQRRASWNQWHVRAEVQRVMRELDVPVGQASAMEEAITGAALEASIRLTPEETNPTPEGVLSRADGASVYSVHGNVRYSHSRVVEAEQHLVEAATEEAGPQVDGETVEAALERISKAAKNPLTAEQRALARRFATGGRRIEVGIGPAGAGKTTAMRALVQTAEDTGVRVVALAPSAAAAAVLSEELGIAAETIAKFLHQRSEDAAAEEGPFALDENTLVLVDEAAMAGTLDLDKVVTAAAEAGAGVRLLGDPAQLNAVAAGGAVRLIEDVVGATNLRQIHRFTTTGEAEASLRLRTGDVTALDFYIEHDRVRGGSLDALHEEVFAAWAADTDQRRTALMLASSGEQVRALNAEAQLHRMERGKVHGSEAVALRDGHRARRGDVVLTRNNDRRLRAGKTDYVKNGDLWTVKKITEDGSVQVRHTRTRVRVTLPPDYLAEHTELGYAATVHRAQGLTVDTCHALLGRGTSRNMLYTALTRGQQSNRAYVETLDLVEPDPHEQVDPARAARDALMQMIRTEGDDGAAGSVLLSEQEEAVSLAHLVPAYEDAIADLLEPGREERLRAVLTRALPPETVEAVLGDPAWPQLAARMAAHEAAGADLVPTLERAAAAGKLTRAKSQAQVLHHRLGKPAPATAAEQHQLPDWITPPPALLEESARVEESVDAQPHEEAAGSQGKAIEINAAAWAWWKHQATTPDDWTGDYLTGRNLGDAEHGRAPASWTALISHLRQEGYAEQELITSGVASRTRDGRVIDRFRDRVLFPIHNSNGDVVAVTARANPATADERTPKYLNHPNHPAYDKSKTLYGLDPAARQAIAAGAPVVICEGAADVAAVRAVSADVVPVAPCGAAITPEQLQVLRELHPDAVRHLIVALDSDAAGQAATARLWDMLEPDEASQARAARLTEKDPAALVEDSQTAQLAEALAMPRPLTHAAIDVALSRADTSTVGGRVAVMHTVLGATSRLDTKVAVAAAAYLAGHEDIDPVAVAEAVIDHRDQSSLAPSTPQIDEEVRAWVLRQADLIEARIDQLVDRVEHGQAAWAVHIAAAPEDPEARRTWRKKVRAIAAYRDRYGITSSDQVLGGTAPDGIQDHARETAHAALEAIAVTDPRHDQALAKAAARTQRLNDMQRRLDQLKTANTNTPNSRRRLHELQEQLNESPVTKPREEPHSPDPGQNGPSM